MAGMSWSDFNSLPDMLSVTRFEILISPSGSTDTNQTLALRCVQCALPDVQVEPMMIGIQGMEFSQAGRTVFDKQIPAAFVETSDGAVQKAIRKWKEDIKGTESGNGKTKQEYATIGTINVLDQSGNIALTYTIYNMWPTQFPQVQMDGSQSQVFIQQIVFQYDKFDPPGGIDVQ